MRAKAPPAEGKKWTRKAFDSLLGPNPSQREKVAYELQWMSHKFPWRGPEWLILQTAAWKLFFLEERRPAHRPRRSGVEPAVKLVMAIHLATGHNPTFIARTMQPVLHPDRGRAGEENRVDYLAKKTRKALAKLSPADAKKLAVYGERCLAGEITPEELFPVAADTPPPHTAPR